MLNKTILTILIFLICLSSGVGLFYPKKAEAIFGLGDIVFDPSNLGQWVKNAALKTKEIAIQGKGLAIDLAKWAWDQKNTALKIAMAKFRKLLLDMIVNEIIVWIQGGGDPKFITDWEGFLRNAADVAGATALEELIGKSTMNELCYGDWGPRINIALSAPQKFENSITCTFDDIKANFTNFTNNFHNGGWEAWIKTTEMQNNPYGLYLLTLDEKLERELIAKEAAIQRASAGSGILSDRVCKQQICVDDYSGQKTTSTGSFAENEIGNDCWCELWETKVPAKIVGDGLSKSLFSDVEWLQNNEEWESYVVAISDALINRFINEGISAIKSSDTGSVGSSSFINQSDLLDTTPPTTTVIAPDAWHVKIVSNEDVFIYYTLDGSEPTLSSSIYIEPIAIDQPTILKWFGMDYNANKESIQSVFLDPPLDITETKPSTTVKPVGLSSVALIANMPAIIYYTTNGTNPSISSKKYMQKIDLSEADFLQWFSINKDGEIEDLQQLIDIIPFGPDNYTYKTIFDLIEPVADFTYFGALLDASKSTDNDETPSIAMYEWDFDNNGVYDWYAADWNKDGIFDEYKCYHTTASNCPAVITTGRTDEIVIGNGFQSMEFPSISKPWEVKVYFLTKEPKTIKLRVTDNEGLHNKITKTIIGTVSNTYDLTP